MNRLVALLAALLLTLPAGVFAQETSDLAIYAKDIRFSTNTLIAGSNIRIYAAIHNEGNTDASAYVFFFQGEIPIGASQIVSVLADGDPDDVWVDFVVPNGAFNIRAELRGQDPVDGNSVNDLALTTLFTPVQDTDGDGVPDDEDNCVFDHNPDQADADGDGMGDVCDPDDDNDGLLDVDENRIGTDQFNPDTDGDGVLDGEDAAPLNADIQTIEQLEAAESAARAESQAAESQNDENGSDEQSETAEDDAVEEVVDDEEVEEVIDEEANEVSESDGKESTSLLEVSPKATFEYWQLTWKTYQFRTLYPAGEGTTFEWEFEGGTTISGRETDFTFPGAGTHKVILRAKDTEGFVVKDEAEIRISFFHIGNPLILALIIGLVLLFLLSIAAVVLYGRRARRRAQAPIAPIESADDDLDADDVEETEEEVDAEESDDESGADPDEEDGEKAVADDADEEEDSNEDEDAISEGKASEEGDEGADEDEESDDEDDDDEELSEDGGGIMGIEEIGVVAEKPKKKKVVKKAKPVAAKGRKTIKRKKS